jgi:iron complex outermembrane receptor protein
MKKKNASLPLVVAGLSLLSLEAVLAQQPTDKDKPQLPLVVEKIVVSATVADEGRDPASVVTLKKDEIDAANRGQDMSMLLAETPNAYAYSDAGNGIGYSYLSLRGFDQRRIAVYVNGVPLNDPESLQVYFIDLADLAGGLSSLQVQRGTGTAHYGSPAVGGVVNLETGALDGTRSGDLTLGGGSFGTFRGAARYTLPLSGGRSSLSLRAAYVRSDGYRDPAWTHHGLGELAYQRVGDDSVLRVRLFGGPERTQLAYLGVPSAYLKGEISGDPDQDRRLNPLAAGEIDDFFQPQLQVLHDRRLGQGVLLKNTLYAILGDGYFRQWSDPLLYSPQGFLPPTSEYPALLVQDAWRQRSVFKQHYGWLPSLSWEHGGGRLVAGFEVRTSGTPHSGAVREGSTCAQPTADLACAVPGPPLASPLTLYDYRTGKTSLSAYARETLRAGNKLALNLELQATRHAMRMHDDAVRGFSWNTGYGFVTPRVGLSFNPDQQLHLYASFSTARSEPRFDDVWNPQDVFQNPASLFESSDAAGRHFEDAKARPERLTAWEAGAGFSRGSTRLRANFYWMDFEDELVYAGGIDQDGLPITDNAARSVHKGVELEAALKLPGAIELLGHAAFSDDRLEDYTLKFGPGPQDELDYSGNRIALFPTHQARLRLQRAFGPARVGLGLRRVGTIYLDNSENERKDEQARQAPGFVDKKIDPFTLADARLELDLKRALGARSLTLLLNVDNLFDERYEASGYSYDQPYFFPGATRSVYVGLRYGF